MAGALAGGFFDQAGDEPGAGVVASVGCLLRGEEPGAGNDALLRMALGKEVEGHCVGMLAQAGFLVEFEGGGEAAQAIHLVAHLGGGDFGGSVRGRRRASPR